MISVDELQEEFNRLKNRPADGFTCQEISELMGWSIVLSRTVVKAALKSGTMLRTRKKYIETISGIKYPAPAFKFKIKKAQ